MSDKKLLDALRNIKGIRIYQFFLDEKTGEITDITSSMEYVKPIRCNDCRLWKTEDCYMCNSCKVGTTLMTESDFCSRAERKEE